MKSSSRKVIASAAFLGLVTGAYPVAAHHSTTMFDREKFIVLEGTVKESFELMLKYYSTGGDDDASVQRRKLMTRWKNASKTSKAAKASGADLAPEYEMKADQIFRQFKDQLSKADARALVAALVSLFGAD